MQAIVLASLKIWIQNLGDDCDGEPPLPIPNREVKPISAENTGFTGKIGRRRDLVEDLLTPFVSPIALRTMVAAKWSSPGFCIQVHYKKEDYFNV